MEGFKKLKKLGKLLVLLLAALMCAMMFVACDPADTEEDKDEDKTDDGTGTVVETKLTAEEWNKAMADTHAALTAEDANLKWVNSLKSVYGGTYNSVRTLEFAVDKAKMTEVGSLYSLEEQDTTTTSYMQKTAGQWHSVPETGYMTGGMGEYLYSANLIADYTLFKDKLDCFDFTDGKYVPKADKLEEVLTATGLVSGLDETEVYEFYFKISSYTNLSKNCVGEVFFNVSHDAHDEEEGWEDESQLVYAFGGQTVTLPADEKMSAEAWDMVMDNTHNTFNEVSPNYKIVMEANANSGSGGDMHFAATIEREGDNVKEATKGSIMSSAPEYQDAAATNYYTKSNNVWDEDPAQNDAIEYKIYSHATVTDYGIFKDKLDDFDFADGKYVPKADKMTDMLVLIFGENTAAACKSFDMYIKVINGRISEIYVNMGLDEEGTAYQEMTLTYTYGGQTVTLPEEE